jgi:two-component system, OmpR family, alkaline phosphatase synthesis response regulator PhoP
MAKKLLIIDDEPDFANLVRDHLNQAGFEAESVYSGDEGLAKIRVAKPDLVVLDVMMPGTDGYTICSEIKNDQSLRDLPVILLTAVASHVPSTRYSHYDGMSMEADDYIAKPATVAQIEEAIRRLVD